MSDELLSATRKRPPALLTALLVFGALVGVLVVFANVWTDWLWFEDLQAGVVFTTLLATRVGLFLGFGLMMAGLLVGNMLLAYRLRPKVRSTGEVSLLVARFRDLLDYRRWSLIGAPAMVLGVLAGLAGLQLLHAGNTVHLLYPLQQEGRNILTGHQGLGKTQGPFGSEILEHQ